MYQATASTVSSGNKLAAVISITGAQQNELLKALPRAELEMLFDQLELVNLPAGKHLFDFGGKIDYSYFPTNAIVSLLYVMESGATTEIAVIGCEGVVGVALYAAERASCSAIVQGGGYGYRLKTEFLREVFNAGGTLAQLMLRYSGALFAQMAQNVVGGRHASIEQKLCRWLLDRLDRSQGRELKVTQDAMANMLGVRRESITVTARKLQDEGLIEYRRGTVTVLDRSSLERRAGHCYRAARAGLDQMRQRAAN
ncbi:CRP-like cAMP-binding protein [Oxalobacteraceae bacterium GrIS 1.11]